MTTGKLDTKGHAVDERPLVLIIEDSPPMAMMLQMILDETYDVVLAYSGQQAMTVLHAQSFHLVLCDIGLPDTDGITLRRKIEADTKLQSIPFIFLTANESDRIATQACELGIDDYLQKPVDPAILLRAVKRSLMRNRQLTHTIGRQLDNDATQRLIPRLPAQIRGNQADLLFREASAGGGDMVMHIPRVHDDLIIIADVTGHGTQAKYFAHLYSGYLYGLLKHLNNQGAPHQIMQHLSNMVYNDENLGGNYVTCQILSVTPKGIDICSAGHPPPFLVSPQGTMLLPDTHSGPMPGLLPDAGYISTRYTLDADQALLCYTDGLLEGNRDITAIELFEVWIAAQSITTLSVQKIWQAYCTHFGSTLHDDVSIFTLRPCAPY